MKKITTLAIILTMCVAANACGSTTGNKDTKTQTAQETTTEPTIEPTIEPTEEPEVLIAMKKKAEVAVDATMKVNSVSKETKITSGSLYYKPKEEKNVFAIIKVTLNNTSDTTTSFNLGYFRLIDADGEEYVPTLITSSTTDKYKFISFSKSMDANYKETGCLAFEVPKDIKIKNCKLCYNSGGILTNTYFKLK